MQSRSRARRLSDSGPRNSLFLSGRDDSMTTFHCFATPLAASISGVVSSPRMISTNSMTVNPLSLAVVSESRSAGDCGVVGALSDEVWERCSNVNSWLRVEMRADRYYTLL